MVEISSNPCLKCVVNIAISKLDRSNPKEVEKAKITCENCRLQAKNDHELDRLETTFIENARKNGKPHTP